LSLISRQLDTQNIGTIEGHTYCSSLNTCIQEDDMDLGGGGVIRRYIFGLVIVLLWVENGVKCSEKAALEGLHPHYEIYLGKAIAHARCRVRSIFFTFFFSINHHKRIHM